MEPTSVVAKAWEQIDAVGAPGLVRARRRVLVTGAGPIGLLAALIGVQRGLEVHVLDRVTDGPKPAARRRPRRHLPPRRRRRRRRPRSARRRHRGHRRRRRSSSTRCAHTAPYGIVCLTGVSSGGRRITVDAGALNREIVLENDVVIGSVNANLPHYEAAADALAEADPGWLRRLITRRVPLERRREAFTPPDGDVKVVIDLSA